MTGKYCVRSQQWNWQSGTSVVLVLVVKSVGAAHKHHDNCTVNVFRSQAFWHQDFGWASRNNNMSISCSNFNRFVASAFLLAHCWKFWNVTRNLLIFIRDEMAFLFVLCGSCTVQHTRVQCNTHVYSATRTCTVQHTHVQCNTHTYMCTDSFWHCLSCACVKNDWLTDWLIYLFDWFICLFIYLLTGWLIDLFIYWLIDRLIYLLTDWLIYLFIYLLTDLFTFLFIYLLTGWLIDLFIYLFIDRLTYLFIYLFIDWLTNLFIYLFICLFIYLLTGWLIDLFIYSLTDLFIYILIYLFAEWLTC